MRNLIIILVFAFALSCSGDSQKKVVSAESDKATAELAQQPTPVQTREKDLFEFTKKNGAHNIKLTFKTKPFDPKEHKIEEKDSGEIKIDGKRILGVDGSIPTTQIEFVKLVFDGKEMDIPKDLFADCYQPNFEKDNFWLKFSDDGESLMAFMVGSDGTGSYSVFWIFRKDGNYQRFSEPMHEGDFRSFANMFFYQ